MLFSFSCCLRPLTRDAKLSEVTQTAVPATAATAGNISCSMFLIYSVSFRLAAARYSDLSVTCVCLCVRMFLFLFLFLYVCSGFPPPRHPPCVRHLNQLHLNCCCACYAVLAAPSLENPIVLKRPKIVQPAESLTTAEIAAIRLHRKMQKAMDSNPTVFASEDK